MELRVAEKNERVTRRRPAVFRELVEAHMRSVYRLAYELTRSHHDAEDLSQDVFVKAYRSLDRFRDEADLDTWLYRITVNTYLNTRRKKSVRFMTLHEDLGDFVRSRGHDASRGAEAHVIRKHLDRVMKQLSPRERTAFVLRCENRLPLRETAAAMGIAEGTVKSLQHRALKKLRDGLAFLDPA